VLGTPYGALARPDALGGRPEPKAETETDRPKPKGRGLVELRRFVPHSGGHE
jgi:hypothetical protein